MIHMPGVYKQTQAGSYRILEYCTMLTKYEVNAMRFVHFTEGNLYNMSCVYEGVCVLVRMCWYVCTHAQAGIHEHLYEHMVFVSLRRVTIPKRSLKEVD